MLRHIELRDPSGQVLAEFSPGVEDQRLQIPFSEPVSHLLVSVNHRPFQKIRVPQLPAPVLAEIQWPAGQPWIRISTHELQLPRHYDSMQLLIRNPSPDQPLLLNTIRIPRDTLITISSDTTLSIIGHSSTQLKIHRVDTVQQALSVHNIRFPTDANGRTMAGTVESTLFFVDPWTQAILSMFEGDLINFTRPQAYTTIQIHNPESFTRNALIRIVPDSSVSHLFRHRESDLYTYTSALQTVVAVPANQRVEIPLPLALNDRQIEEIQTQVGIEVFDFGNPTPSYRSSIQVQIRYHYVYRYVILGMSIIIGLIGLIIMGLRLNRVIDTLSARHVVITAILSAIAFTLRFAVQLLDQSVFTLFGPFQIFISGFFSEYIGYLLMALLVMYLKNANVVIIYLMMQTLLSLIFTGNTYLFALTGLGIHLLLLPPLFRMYLKSPGRWSILLFIPLYDLLISFIDISNFQILYGVFYADWYIILYISLVGFLYTMIGLLSGKRIGFRLNRILPA